MVLSKGIRQFRYKTLRHSTLQVVSTRNIQQMLNDGKLETLVQLPYFTDKQTRNLNHYN